MRKLESLRDPSFKSLVLVPDLLNFDLSNRVEQDVDTDSDEYLDADLLELVKYHFHLLFETLLVLNRRYLCTLLVQRDPQFLVFEH